MAFLSSFLAGAFAYKAGYMASIAAIFAFRFFIYLISIPKLAYSVLVYAPTFLGGAFCYLIHLVLVSPVLLIHAFITLGFAVFPIFAIVVWEIDIFSTLFSVAFIWRYSREFIHLWFWTQYKPTTAPAVPTLYSQDVTIIIPTTKGDSHYEEELGECLQSCSENCPAEIYVVVDTTDNLPIVRKVVENTFRNPPKAPIHIKCCGETNKRKQQAIAIRSTQTALTLFLDDHVYLKPECLKTVVREFEDKNVYLCATRKKVRRQYPERKDTWWFMNLIEWWHISFWNVMGILYIERNDFEIRAANTADNGAYVVSGRASFIRTSLIKSEDYLYKYLNEYIEFPCLWRTIKVGPIISDDDNFHTREVIRRKLGIRVSHTNETTGGRPAFVFDVDGTLSGGKTRTEDSSELLQQLQRDKRLVLFLTNNGGCTEEEFAANLSKRFGVKVRGSQVVLSHTPFRELAKDYESHLIIAIGRGDIKQLAHRYGFKNVITPEALYEIRPKAWPYADLELGSAETRFENQALLKIPEAIILVFNCPRAWGLACCYIRLALCGGLGVKVKACHFSHSDMTWPGEDAETIPGLGTFKETVKNFNGRPIPNCIVGGKPTQQTMKYAENQLSKLNEELNKKEGTKDKIGTVYMIGDNPGSDIKGCNDYVSPSGIVWESILVATGEWTWGTPVSVVPSYYAKTASEGVTWALKQEGTSLGDVLAHS
ncbi:HAD-like domain-containing protein [Xylaria palmicola]|nr:HAD-like domain-containing protein [Xylaria palmicola]